MELKGLSIAEQTLFDSLPKLLKDYSGLPSVIDLQRAWDHMFMIDIKPSNKVRFGLNVEEIVLQVQAAPSS